jgi:hypothetical protein
LFITVSESKHYTVKPRWILQMAAANGWGALCSEPPGVSTVGHKLPGGTIIFWRRTIGKVTFHRSKDHSRVALQTQKQTIVAVYGPNKNCPSWVEDTLEWTDKLESTNPKVIVGDFNWKRHYQNCLLGDWEMVDNSCFGTDDDTSPSRCLTSLCHAENVTSVGISGIPYHRMLSFRINIQQKVGQRKRLRRTAGYKWIAGLPAFMVDDIVEQVNRDFPKKPEGDLLENWLRWHRRAEECIKLAVEAGAVEVTTKAERMKGSMPTQRPVSSQAKHRQEESVALRRVRRFSRQIEQSIKENNSARVDLSPKQLSSFAWLCYARLLVPTASWPALGEVAGLASRAITQLEEDKTRRRQREWRQKFKHWSSEVWEPLRPLMREPAGSPGFDADTMREEWAEIWTPPNNDSRAHFEAWKQRAEQVAWPKTSVSPNWLPTEKDLDDAIAKSGGGAGLDGWSASEIKKLLRTFRVLKLELLQLWKDTTVTAKADPEKITKQFIAMILAWRVAGIPKKQETQSRPIGVANVALRIWLSACATCLPQPEEDQWAGKRGSSVPGAISAWLAACFDGLAGAEMDLTKAYDLIEHEIAAAGLTFEEVPDAIICLCCCVWAAPRFCQVEQQLSLKPVLPTRSLPQGESMAPGAMMSTLVPWRPPQQNIKKFAFMDDRSLVASGAQAQAELAQALSYTADFDTQVGNQENQGKRQNWCKTDSEYIEHLGIKAVPGDALTVVLPREGWGKLHEAIKRIATIPGSQNTREHAAAAFLKPLWEWALPVTAAPPADTPKLLFKAIIRSRCRWWCQARWWTRRIQLHPLLGALLTTASRAKDERITWSPFLDNSVKELAEANGFSYVKRQVGRGIQLHVEPDDDFRIIRATANLADTNGNFWIDTPEAHHALRLCCRVRVFSQIHFSRHDAEAASRVDLDATSTKVWKQFEKSLDDDAKWALNIWLSGAVSTQTRRQGMDVIPHNQIKCMYCGQPAPSARHLWASCPKYSAVRATAQAKFSVPPAWWEAQPRVTAKTGWITFEAAGDAEERGAFMAAACFLGISIVQNTGAALTSNC